MVRRRSGSRAHPRSRGEDSPSAVVSPGGWGSSPLTRGKLLDLGFPCGVEGLIPAHAGKTTPHFWESSHCRAHPRSRGENLGCIASLRGLLGSSPLTRGKLCQVHVGRQAQGLIPAHAGKTAAAHPDYALIRAHPRSRGENIAARSAAVSMVGSSPLTRGKLLCRDYRRVLHGLIPAHAGKTRGWSMPCWRLRAHPRSRGENVVFPLLCVVALGSSPLTRGKPAQSD